MITHKHLLLAENDTTDALDERRMLLSSNTKNHTTITINETTRRGTYGDLQISDIINYVRTYLTDNDLIHYNQLSRAFAGEYNAKGVYIRHQIEAAQLSSNRQLKIYERFCNHYGNQEILPIAPTHRLQELLYHYRKQNPYYIFNIKRQLIDECNQTIWERMTKQKQNNHCLKKNNALINEMISAAENSIETQCLIKHFWKLIVFLTNPENRNKKLVIAWLLFCVLPFVLTAIICPIIIERKTPPAILGIADIHITHINVWMNSTELSIISCEKALNDSDINAFGNFSANLTQAALFSCTTWIRNCTPSATFDSQHTNISKGLQVGCDYDYTSFLGHKARLKEIWADISVIGALISPLIYLIPIIALTLFYHLARLIFYSLLGTDINDIITRHYSAAKILTTTTAENFIEEKKADQIIAYHTSFFKNIRNLLPQQAQREAPTISLQAS